MNEPTTNTQTEETETVTVEPVESVGDIMSEASRRAIKKWVIFFSILVYLGGITYAEVHGLNVLTKGVPPDMRIWATLGMIAAGVTAIILPLAHLAWTFEHMQRYAALGFYLLDFAFLALNAFVDFNVNTGQTLAPWAKSYMTNILPASPLIVAGMWAILWELDPSTKAHVLRQTLRASIQEAKANQITKAAKAESVTKAVQAAADAEVEQALTDLFGRKVTTMRKPVTVNDDDEVHASHDDDDGWQIWKDGYQQGKRYQSTAKAPELKEQPAQADSETDAKLEYRPTREERK